MSDIKDLDEHKWSDSGFFNKINVTIKKGYDLRVEVDFFGKDNAFFLNDDDLRVLLNAKGYDMVKRSDTLEAE